MTAFDVVGDIHGELPALTALGRFLGYDVAKEEWPHPEGRRLVFLGDLVDRGAHSLEVAQLVRRLCLQGRAACIMGNHEYNHVAFALRVPGYEEPKSSNRSTIEDIRRRPTEWTPILEFFRTLPIGLELAGLRVIHACWHLPSLESAGGFLAPQLSTAAVAHWADAHVVLASPFTATRLKPGLSSGDEDADDAPHEVLMKGYEVTAAAPFQDNDGKLRTKRRETWWNNPSAPVLRDKTLVVGHYWNLPPDKDVNGTFCPPHASGTPELRAWQAAGSAAIPDSGRARCDAGVICVDFNGVTAESARACAGALRWPEREVAWATAPRTRLPSG